MAKCLFHNTNWNIGPYKRGAEGETRGASRSKRKYRKATPKKANNNATMPLLWLQSYRRNYFSSAIYIIPKPCWSFRAGVLLNRSFSFLFLLLSRASPPFVSYDMDHLSTVKSKEGHGFLVPWKRTQEVHASCGAHASGLGAESMGTANTRREKSLLMNRMTYARKQISRNGKGNRKI